MRRYVSILLFFCLVVMGVSGVVLYIMPHGRIAYWVRWHLFGLNKDQWGNVHIVFGFAMVVLGVWHLFLNWKAFLNYLKGRLGILTSREFVLSLVAVIFVFAGTVYDIYPFKVVSQVGERIKESWAKSITPPPVPHAEKLPLSKIAQMLGASPEDVVAFLKKRGFKVKGAFQPFGEIARENGMTPAGLYEIVSSAFSTGKASNEKFTFTGLGRLTIGELCKKLGLSPSQCEERLEKNSIRASLSDEVKDVAFRHGMAPRELAELIAGR